MLDDSIMIAIRVNCSVYHNGAEDSLECALINIFREILAMNHINVILFVDVFR